MTALAQPSPTPLGHPAPRGQTTVYLEALERDLGFACSLQTAISCTRVEESIEYTVDVSATPTGRIEALHIFAIANGSGVDLRLRTDTVASHMAAIAQPLIGPGPELDAVLAALRRLVGAWTPGDVEDVDGIEVGVAADGDSNYPDGAMVMARIGVAGTVP